MIKRLLAVWWLLPLDILIMYAIFAHDGWRVATSTGTPASWAIAFPTALSNGLATYWILQARR